MPTEKTTPTGTPTPTALGNPTTDGQEQFEDLPPVDDADGNEELAFVTGAFEQLQQEEGDGNTQVPVVEATPPPASTQTETPPTEVPPQPQVVEAAPTPQAPPAQAAQPPVVVPVPGQAEQPTQGTPAADPTQAFSLLQQRIAAAATEIVETIATDPKSPYRLNEQEVEELQTDPAKVIARVAARTQIHTTQGILTHIARQLPGVVYGLMEAQRRNTELEGKFFDQWKPRGLDRTNPQHTQTVTKIGTLYRQMHPNATAEEFNRMVGAQALVALGLVGKPRAQQPGATRQQPFAPARGGHGAPPNKVQQNPWAALAEQILADDLGANE